MYRKQIILLGLFYCFTLATLQAQERIGISLDQNQVLIGDPVLLKVEIQLPSDATIESLHLNIQKATLQSSPAANPGNGGLVPVPEKESAPDLEIQSQGKWKALPDTTFIIPKEQLLWDTLTSGKTTILVNTLRLIPWDAGVITLAPMDLNFSVLGESRQLRSNVLELRVANAEAPPGITVDSMSLAPIKDIRQEPLTWMDFLPWILGTLGVLLLVFLLWYFFFGRKKEIPAAPLTRKVAVHELALEKLAALKKAQLWQQGQVKAYQSELTFIVREYLENRYHIQALESPTSEILDQMKTLDFAAEDKRQLQEMLQLADMVKFAKAEPEASMHNRLMEYSEKFIRQTKPQNLTEESEEGWVEVPLEVVEKASKGSVFRKTDNEK